VEQAGAETESAQPCERGRQKVLEEVTMERVLQRQNLRAAYLAVKANAGAPGIDGMGVEEMKAHIAKHWESIEGRLLAGKYRPAAVRAVEIPKASGGVRRLGIPTVMDRMIQQALNQGLSPTFEEGFSEGSYGFRPARSAQDAVRRAQGYVAGGKSWVVDIDLKNFFDQVNHDRLMRMVAGKVRDKRVLGLVVNREKSGAGPSGGSSLLGFRLYEDGRIGVSPKAIQGLKERVRECWEARQSKTSEQLREQWQRYIGGWWNYFELADRRWEVNDLRGWIRRHMRKCFWLRWHHRRGRYNALRRLGVKGRALGVASCGRGAWAMARHVVVQQALKIRTLNTFGFIVPWDLAAAH
jgi:hypothetical protein